MLFGEQPPLPPTELSQPVQELIVDASAHRVRAHRRGKQSAISAESSERILKTFLEMVQIPSPSGQETEMRQYVHEKLKALGLQQYTTIDAPGNLILKLPSNVGSQRTVLIAVHLDVVPPCQNVKPVIEGSGDERIIRSSGDTVLGGDDKASIAALLEALELALKNNLPRPNLIIPITVREEIGGQGAAEMDPKEYAGADVAFALDGNDEQGRVIYAAPQLTTFEITVTGQSAHSGFEPEKGANAIQAMTIAVSKFRQGRLDPITTANVGSIHGGKKFNIVPDKVVAMGEVRSLEPKRVDEEISDMKQKLDEAVRQVPGTRYAWQHQNLILAYQTDLDQPIFEPLKQAMRDTGLELRPCTSNGGSDVNVFAAHGIPSVVLSGAYYNPHQVNEYVKLKDMMTLTQLLLNLMRNYAR